MKTQKIKIINGVINVRNQLMEDIIVSINVLKKNARYVVNTNVMTQRKNGKIVNVVINFVLMTLVLKTILKIFTLIKNQIKQGE